MVRLTADAAFPMLANHSLMVQTWPELVRRVEIVPQGVARDLHGCSATTPGLEPRAASIPTDRRPALPDDKNR